MPRWQVTDVVERFWHKVEQTDGCWTWKGASNKLGYGSFHDGEKVVPAHRFSYKMLVGPIPTGLVIDHLCRNPSCVNPAHLEPVTRRVNSIRGVSANFDAFRENRCTHGHPLNDLNTYIEPKSGRRRCRTCRKKSSAEGHRRRSKRGAA